MIEHESARTLSLIQVVGITGYHSLVMSMIGCGTSLYYEEMVVQDFKALFSEF